jgi:hypothetical protein
MLTTALALFSVVGPALKRMARTRESPNATAAKRRPVPSTLDVEVDPTILFVVVEPRSRPGITRHLRDPS